MLLPGEHEVAVRQSGYDDFIKKIVIEPGQVQTVNAVLLKSPLAAAPAITATLKLSIEPKRAAVFLDDKFVGHASESLAESSDPCSSARARIASRVSCPVTAPMKRKSIF